MAYEIHIERLATDGTRSTSGVTLDEWKLFVDSKEDLRFESDAVAVTNPATGKKIMAFPQGYGNTEMLIDNQWLPVFRWRDGTISFNGQPSFEERTDPVRIMVIEIAMELGAAIVGDDGESYDRA